MAVSKMYRPPEDGWGIAEDAHLSRRATDGRVVSPAPLPPSARLTGGELDDGWVLPAELETGLGPPPASPPIAALDLNRASFEELCALPGIGRLRARRLLRWREERGPFRRLEDLLAIQGFGRKTLEQVRDRVVFG